MKDRLTDDRRLRKTTIAFLKDYADKGYENAVECIDWLEKQGEQNHIEDNLEMIEPTNDWSEEDEQGENSPILSNSLNIGKNEPKFKEE